MCNKNRYNYVSRHTRLSHDCFHKHDSVLLRFIYMLRGASHLKRFTTFPGCSKFVLFLLLTLCASILGSEDCFLEHVELKRCKCFMWYSSSQLWMYTYLLNYASCRSSSLWCFIILPSSSSLASRWHNLLFHFKL